MKIIKCKICGKLVRAMVAEGDICPDCAFAVFMTCILIVSAIAILAWFGLSKMVENTNSIHVEQKKQEVLLQQLEEKKELDEIIKDNDKLEALLNK